MKKSIVIGTLGFPGSGKTSFSKKLADKLGFFHLNADKIRLTMFKNPNYSFEENRIVFRLMDFFTEELLKKGISVAYDANLNKKISRDKLRNIAERTSASFILAWFRVDPKIALERMQNRGKDEDDEMFRSFDENVFYKLKGNLDEPEGEDSVIEIGGDIPFEEQLKQFLEKSNL